MELFAPVRLQIARAFFIGMLALDYHSNRIQQTLQDIFAGPCLRIETPRPVAGRDSRGMEGDSAILGPFVARLVGVKGNKDVFRAALAQSQRNRSL